LKIGFEGGEGGMENALRTNLLDVKEQYERRFKDF
jgi:hypothetical protein